MRWQLASLALIVALSGGRGSAAAEVEVRVVGCVESDAVELRRLLQIELAAVRPKPRVSVVCRGEQVVLRLGKLSRRVDLRAAAPGGGGPRLLALAVAELAEDGRWQRRETSAKGESPMFRKILSTSLVTALASIPPSLGAPPPAPKREIAVVAPDSRFTHPPPRTPEKREMPALRDRDLLAEEAHDHAVTVEQIKVLQRLIDNTRYGDPDRADLLFRMGELYASEQSYYEHAARNLDQKIFDAKPKNPSLASRLQNEQADLQARAEKSLLEAARRYIEVADHPADYAQYERMDELLFTLAYLLTEAKRDDAARIYYKRLIKDYPGSKLVPDAYLAFGEFYFEKKDLESALRFYDKVLQFPSSRFYVYAKYKEAWVHVNLGDHGRALALFVEVIDLSRDGKGSGTKSSRLSLEREAKKDAVRAYAQVGSPDKAWPFFQRIGGDSAQTMLEQLGEIWGSQGKFRDAIAIYHRLMSLSPTSPRLCAWQFEVVRNELSATGSKAVPSSENELERLSAVYQKMKAIPNVKPDQMNDCREATANSLREMAMTWHREAQVTAQLSTYRLAHSLYRKYLEQFKGDKEVYETTYYLGELLWKQASFAGESGRYCDAATVYTDVVKMDPRDSAKYLKDAALASVLSWRGCLKIADAAPVVSDGRNFSPMPIPEQQKKMIEAFETYIRYVKNSPELLRVKYQEGREYYEYNHFDEAIPLFREVARAKDEELSVVAANLLFDCHAMKKQTPELAAAVAEHCHQKELLAVPGFAPRCGMIEASLLRQEAERHEHEHRWREAAEAYLKLAAAFPDYPQIDEVYYDAAIDFQRAKMVGRALQCFQQLLAVKPDSGLARKTTFAVGRSYQSIAAYDSAADAYERFATRWSDDKEAPTALLTAAFFRRGLGQNAKAIEDTEQFVRSFGPRANLGDRVAGVAFDENQIFEQQKNWDELQKHLKDYLKHWSGKGGIDRQIVAHVRLGELAWRASCPIEGVQGACIEVKKPATHLALLATRARRKPKTRSICGTEAPHLVVRDRSPSLMKEAHAHFTEALRLFNNGAALKGIKAADEMERAARANELAYYATEARMLEGDAAYEKFLKVQIPTALDFVGQKKRSEAKLTAWIGGKMGTLELARKTYEAVILSGQAHWAIAASARIGQLFQNFSSQLNNAPVPTPPPPPPGVRSSDWAEIFTDEYCHQFEDEIIVLEDKAIEALGTCLSTSTRLSWYSEWSSLCESELNAIQPLRFPLATEIRAEPGYVSYRMEKSAVVTRMGN
jgi:tetratricopeptide (TPR) repeat protein